MIFLSATAFPSPVATNIIHWGVRKKQKRKHILCFNAAEIGQQQQHLIHQHLETPRPGKINGKRISPEGADVCLAVFALAICFPFFC